MLSRRAFVARAASCQSPRRLAISDLARFSSREGSRTESLASAHEPVQASGHSNTATVKVRNANAVVQCALRVECARLQAFATSSRLFAVGSLAMQLVLKHRQRLLTLVIDADEPLRVLAQRIVDALGQELDASALTLVSSSVRGCKPQQQPDMSIQAAGACCYDFVRASVRRERVQDMTLERSRHPQNCASPSAVRRLRSTESTARPFDIYSCSFLLCWRQHTCCKS